MVVYYGFCVIKCISLANFWGEKLGHDSGRKLGSLHGGKLPFASPTRQNPGQSGADPKQSMGGGVAAWVATCMLQC